MTKGGSCHPPGHSKTGLVGFFLGGLPSNYLVLKETGSDSVAGILSLDSIFNICQVVVQNSTTKALTMCGY